MNGLRKLLMLNSKRRKLLTSCTPYFYTYIRRRCVIPFLHRPTVERRCIAMYSLSVRLSVCLSTHICVSSPRSLVTVVGVKVKVDPWHIILALLASMRNPAFLLRSIAGRRCIAMYCVCLSVCLSVRTHTYVIMCVLA